MKKLLIKSILFSSLSSAILLGSLSIVACSNKNEEDNTNINNTNILNPEQWPTMNEDTEKPLLASTSVIKQIEDILIIGSRNKEINYKKELDKEKSKELIQILTSNLLIEDESITINEEMQLPENTLIKEIEYKKIGNELENKIKLKFRLIVNDKNKVVQLIIKNTNIDEIYTKFFDKENYTFDKKYFIDQEDSILKDITIQDKEEDLTNPHYNFNDKAEWFIKANGLKSKGPISKLINFVIRFEKIDESTPVTINSINLLKKDDKIKMTYFYSAKEVDIITTLTNLEINNENTPELDSQIKTKTFEVLIK